MVKKISYILLCACSLLLAACEVIPEGERLIEVDAPETVSRALLVEFTGFLCVNCPNAAQEAHRLMEQYPEELVVVEMHPATNAFCQTTIAEYDLTCEAADAYYKAHGGTAGTSFPTGVVDGNSPLTDYTSWGALIYSATHRKKTGELTLAVETGEKLHIDASFEPGDAELSLWLVEDSIVSPQMMPDGSTNMHYVHNHVLRASLSVGDNELPERVNGVPVRAQHCAVVGVLTDKANGTVLDVRHVVLNDK